MWKVKGQKRSNGSSKDLQSVPPLFLCPISLDIMKDPVTVLTGQTYDRVSIEKWLQQGHRSCPITMLPLHDLSLIPNLTVQRLIQSWRAENEADESSRPVESSCSPKPPENKEHILFCFRSIARSHNVKSAVRNLRLLAREEANRAHIVEAGGTLLLVYLLSEDHEECDACEDALLLLAVLCRSSGEARAVVTEPQAMAWVVWHLQTGNTSITRLNSAALLKSLLVCEQFRKTAGKVSGLLQGLLLLLKENLSARAAKALVKMLRLICSSRGNRVKAVEAGTLRTFIDMLATATPSTVENLLATIELLCTTPEGQAEACTYPLTVPVVVKLTLGFSKQCTEHAIGILLSICMSGPVEVLQVVFQAGARRQLLLLLQSDCSALAKRKALDLLKLFHAIFETDPAR